MSLASKKTCQRARKTTLNCLLETEAVIYLGKTSRTVATVVGQIFTVHVNTSRDKSHSQTSAAKNLYLFYDIVMIVSMKPD